MSAARQFVNKLPVVVILGATATGKSKLAIEIAKRFNGEIVSADSMQVYKGLDIVTNKVTAKEMQECPHHMINYVNPLHYHHSAFDFQSKALPIIEEILSMDRIPIIVGGTVYYIESLLWELLVTRQPNEAYRCKAKNEAPAGGSGENETSNCPSPTPEGATGTRIKSEPSGSGSEGEAKTDISRLSVQEMYALLEKVDMATARKTHPKDKRKIFRALEVWQTVGRPLSEVLAEQHAMEGGGGVSGPLRYNPSIVFNIDCDREVLTERIDKRVDEMVEIGLVKELLDFHERYNTERLKENRLPDYTLGIFQSIGFKELHEYLILSAEERNSDKGKTLLKFGLEEMKRVTRRYARKQDTWFKNRFLKRRGSTMPDVYSVSSTDPSKWQEDVHDVAVCVLQAVIEGRDPPVTPLAVTPNTNTPAYNTCTICDMVFINTHTWTLHMNGRRHRNALKRKRRWEVMEKEAKKECNQQEPTDDSIDLQLAVTESAAEVIS